MRQSAQEEVTRARDDLARAKVELDLIERALSKQTRSGQRTSSVHKRAGDTREAVLQAMADGPLTISPAQIIAAVHASGSSLKKGTIRAMIRRLVDEEQVKRIAEGQYQLASRNGSSGESNAGSTENEATEPRFTAAEPQEG